MLDDSARGDLYLGFGSKSGVNELLVSQGIIQLGQSRATSDMPNGSIAISSSSGNLIYKDMSGVLHTLN